MNQFIQYGGVQSIPIYNCSAYTAEQWTQKDGISRPVLGITESIFEFLVELLYFPMMFVMLEKPNFKMSCYKIMAFLAVVDMISISLCCILTGILAYRGAVFCSYPELIYFAGIIIKSFWCCSCITALILISNRILDLLFPQIGRFLFDGNRTFIVLLFATCYMLYFAIDKTPSLFTSKFHSWFFDPMIFEGRGKDYESIPCVFNNFFVVFATCFLYIVFCFVLGSELKNVNKSSASFRVSIQILFQSALICLMNLTASMIYMYMNYFESPLWLIIFGNLVYQLGCCSPVFVYFTCNKTIRNGLLRKFGLKKKTAKVSIVTSKSV
ncbi:hypothetical protein B9Z55_018253 [Caenorhabditis nigoni]|uniref:G-protein coupled receptors family 1 profile domain-containing protein n=1 Tax=Caenorhabditis nigoni TaxID=1611254 RepID=A0A2G5TDW6_9PELO|nr:hypothetical protein B9Z55_018253 [Caenorhabditis nigoni]